MKLLFQIVQSQKDPKNFHIFLKISNLLEKSMKLGMDNYKQSGFRGVTETWDVFQHEVSL